MASWWQGWEREEDIAARLLEACRLPDADRAAIEAEATGLVEAVRADAGGHGLLGPFLQEYGLSNREGVILMCLAEAMLRIPDAETADKLIADKMTAAEWERHLSGDSMLVNLSTRSLLLTAWVLELNDDVSGGVLSAVNDLVKRVGRPVIRLAVIEAMRLLGHQFVMGRTIAEALKVAGGEQGRAYRYSFDMLGEAALTAEDAARYLRRYDDAIAATGAGCQPGELHDNPGISVKLSALHPRYEHAQRARVLEELTPRLLLLAEAARRHDMGLTIDAEESHRLDLSMELVDALLGKTVLSGWNGLGVVVQAYNRRAPEVIDQLAGMARRHGKRLMVRLVKGAYWDSELKRAQEMGLEDYPLFTRKATTDLCYQACAARLLAAPDAFYPQFATHNARSMATVRRLAGEDGDYEFQRLHGMGEVLHGSMMARAGRPCRIYAPVGEHRELLPYLVRRLLENGANSSFVNQIEDEDVPVADLIRDPVETVESWAGTVANPAIPRPPALFGPGRANSRGLDLRDPSQAEFLRHRLHRFDDRQWTATPILGGQMRDGEGPSRLVRNPADHARAVGRVSEATGEQIHEAVARATKSGADWRGRPVRERADCLRRAADMLNEDFAELVALCIAEAGKSWVDAVADLREAIDFLRYYAEQAELLEPPRPGGQRVMACISPWNFPIAIFTGQVAGCLVAGHPVIAKPAEQTPLMAAAVVERLHQAGVPGDVLALLPGDGPHVGAPLVAHPGVGGVCFTGSMPAAAAINRTLAAKGDPHAPLIAETGGLNAMIIDSTALPEQAIQDVVASAFQSAGQRCSALRLLYVQEDIAARFIKMLIGAMDELTVGDPALLRTDIGPVIDAEAKAHIESYIAAREAEGRLLHRLKADPAWDAGTFVAPCLIRLEDGAQLREEIFGPVLHVTTFAAAALDRVIEKINDSGYGLTLGVHSRIDSTFQHVAAQARVGNVYVNRNQIGAVVGVQPFGGEGLSGTGPKAGGPHYLRRLMEAPPAMNLSGDAPPDMVPPPDLHPLEAVVHLRPIQERWSRVPPMERAAVISRAAAGLGRAPVSGPADGGLEGGGRQQAARVMAEYAGEMAGPHGFPQRLPGPTGEDNELYLAGRGVILCRAEGPRRAFMLLAQIAAALAAGNAVALCLDPFDRAWFKSIQALLVGAGLPQGLITVLDGADLSSLAAHAIIDGIAFAGPDQGAWVLQRLLAGRPGPILPLILADPEDTEYPAGPIHRFATERTVTVNTAAMGGNAELLGAGEG